MNRLCDNRRNSDFISVMSQKRCFCSNFSAHSFNKSVKTKGQNIHAFFAVIINNINRFYVIFNLAVIKTERLDDIFNIDSFGVIDFLCKVVAHTKRQDHHRGICPGKTVDNLVHCAVTATGHNDAVRSILLCVLGADNFSIATLVSFLNNHIVINLTECGLNSVKQLFLVIITCNRINYKNILHLTLPLSSAPKCYITCVPPTGRIMRTWQLPSPNTPSIVFLYSSSISFGTKA